MKNISFTSSVEYLSKLLDVDVTGMKVSQNKSKTEKELENFMATVKRLSRMPHSEFKYSADTTGIKRYRNFTSDTLDRFKVVYANSIDLYKKTGEKYTLYDRIVIPIIKNGKQIAITIRKVKSKDFPKWLHQPRGIKLESVLYNYDNVIGENSIVVTEGIFDMWAFYEIGIPAVCTFGANLSHQQYILLLQTGADIVMAYDGDSAGKKATLKAIKLLKNKANISVVEFEDGQDPENITREELKVLYEKRKKY